MESRPTIMLMLHATRGQSRCNASPPRRAVCRLSACTCSMRSPTTVYLVYMHIRNAWDLQLHERSVTTSCLLEHIEHFLYVGNGGLSSLKGINLCPVFSQSKSGSVAFTYQNSQKLHRVYSQLVPHIQR